jgi:hypothetical protein
MFRRIGMLMVGLVFVVTLIPFSARGTGQLSKKGESTEPNCATKIRISETYGSLPLHFEANQGQVDERVRFLSRGSGYNLLLTSNEAVLTLSRRENNQDSTAEREDRKRGGESLIQTGTLRMRWEGANEDEKIEGVEGLEGKSHYFLGNDPGKWRSNISLYRKVRYRDLYPGVDLIYYGNQRQLEYDLVVTPEGDPNAIRLAIEGAEEVRVNGGGDLVVRINGGEVIQHKPLIYQEREGKREIIRGGYVVENLGQKQHEKGKVRISFKIDHFDSGKPLIIDPYLVYSTYFGANSLDRAYAIAVDSLGSAYITGYTYSTNFPRLNAFQGTFGGGTSDVFVTKLNPSGTALVYSTYLGGNGNNDYGYGIAVDRWGYAYVTGNTDSTNFPILNPIQGTYGGGYYDAFVTKLDPSGSALVYSTYLGGNANELNPRIAVDGSGNAYVTGGTYSTDFPIFPTSLNPFQPSNAGGSDAFVTKLDSSGTAVYSTYLGGSNWDGALAIAVDSSGNAYITGETKSSNFPTNNPIQASIGGTDDAFVTKLNPSGTALLYSTFLGGKNGWNVLEYDMDYGTGIAVDDSGSAYVVGSTWCIDFPTVNPIQGSNAGSRDLFIVKLNPAGTALVYSTYLGGSNDDNSNAIAVDSTGSAYITGFTNSTDFPTSNATQGIYGGGSWDAFVTKVNPPGSALVYSTYLGGNDVEYGYGIAVDSSGAAYIAGYTSSTNFPTANPLQGSYAGSSDAFVTKIGSGTPPPTHRSDGRRSAPANALLLLLQ